MVESEAHELPEEVMLGAVVFGHQQQQAVIDLIHSLVEEGGKPEWDWQPPAKDEALLAKVTEAVEGELRDAYQMRQKQARQQALKEIYKGATADVLPADASPDAARTGRQHDLRSRSEDRPPADPGRRGAHRRPRHAHRSSDRHPHRRASAHARLGALHARRNAGAGRLRRSAPRATSRSSTRSWASTAIASCSTTTSRRTPRARPAAWARPSAARSATAASPSAR